ncbi:Mechanosensitive channel MscK precursor [Poriferisphaera corsica]|uniref:Mechanosensitive channel MscK n=1 Tax=Poriferisphaera corsica TaxID=2528020 RepID=A0A517YTF4_9BACT|nr:mechanosensitive ion channel domain-containing protein [Poriferisphaera corsica]QDU33491.1 Mechanosensitive channel MscK precursor [Poriferisphaera corsica]
MKHIFGRWPFYLMLIVIGFFCLIGIDLSESFGAPEVDVHQATQEMSDATDDVDPMLLLGDDIDLTAGDAVSVEGWKRVWRKIVYITKKIWYTPIYEVGESDISIQHMVVALLAAVIGFWLSKRASMMVYHRLRKMKRVSATTALQAQKLLFYLLAIFVTLFALQLMGIPITLFTVLGGAVAIGVSFGAQNVIGNFISGIIVMTERPIRLGDTIVLEGGMEGLVEDIGQRSTRVRRIDGVDVIVPNSKFVDQSVTNWTLSDDVIRSCVCVGVAYGSDVELVKSLLMKVVEAHQQILDTHKPIVVFDDFGDNALMFEVYFWAKLKRPMQRLILQSDIRFSIDREFKEAEIVIAYPQRDVHLNGIGTVDVRMVNNGATN